MRFEKRLFGIYLPRESHSNLTANIQQLITQSQVFNKKNVD